MNSTEFKGSKNWRIRQVDPNDDSTIFVQADRLSPTHGYDIDVLGDDANYPAGVKAADARLIVAAPHMFRFINMLPGLLPWIRDKKLRDSFISDIEQINKAVLGE